MSGKLPNLENSKYFCKGKKNQKKPQPHIGEKLDIPHLITSHMTAHWLFNSRYNNVTCYEGIFGLTPEQEIWIGCGNMDGVNSALTIRTYNMMIGKNNSLNASWISRYNRTWQCIGTPNHIICKKTPWIHWYQGCLLLIFGWFAILWHGTAFHPILWLQICKYLYLVPGYFWSWYLF